MDPRISARARVERLLRAARTLVTDEALSAEVAERTGLSRAGVRLALSNHLEHSPPEEEITVLLEGAAAAPTSHVHVILSANVFTAPLRALAVAWAAAPTVSVRPSRREPTFARALVHAVGVPELVLQENAEVAAIAGGEVHVYGNDETVAQVRAAARDTIRVRAHGTGLGVAMVTGHDIEGAARRLAEDIVVFDQRGCLSPRLAVVVGDPSTGCAFADAVAAALDEQEKVVPRGTLSAGEAREAARYLETMRFAGRVVSAPGVQYGIGISDDQSSILVPPPGRHLHIVCVRGVEEARGLLAPFLQLVVAVSTDDPEAVRGALPASRARISALGMMQKPPFDGPVDLR